MQSSKVHVCCSMSESHVIAGSVKDEHRKDEHGKLSTGKISDRKDEHGKLSTRIISQRKDKRRLNEHISQLS